MVCRNEQYRAAIQWDDNAIYGFVFKSTEYDCCLVDAVNSLPPICRKTVILFAFERIPREVIAAMLQVSLSTVRFLIHHGGILIREYLEDQRKHTTIDFTLNRLFAGWPYLEYAELVKLRKSLVFLSKL
jgi:DNA-directed RNA polymerase specialized sigma24 family protein